jgi:hypothetical protein
MATEEQKLIDRLKELGNLPNLDICDGMMVEKQVERICGNCRFWEVEIEGWGDCLSSEVKQKVYTEIKKFYQSFGCIHWKEKLANKGSEVER